MRCPDISVWFPSSVSYIGFIPGFIPWFYTLVSYPGFIPRFHTLVSYPGFIPHRLCLVSYPVSYPVSYLTFTSSFITTWFHSSVCKIFNSGNFVYDSESESVTCPYMYFVHTYKLTTSLEMLLWMTPSEVSKALQASDCSELLDPMRASNWISVQH